MTLDDWGFAVNVLCDLSVPYPVPELVQNARRKIGVRQKQLRANGVDERAALRDAKAEWMANWHELYCRRDSHGKTKDTR